MKYKIALLMNKDITSRILNDKSVSDLCGFADFSDISTLPEKVDEAFMRKEIQGAHACITCWGTPALTENVLAEAPGLQMIAHAAGSVKYLIPECTWEKGIRVTSAAPVIARDVAETVLGLMITSLKDLWEWNKLTKSGVWRGEKSLDNLKRLHNLRIGIIGASHVGRSLINILKPFQVKVLLYDPYVNEENAAMLGVEKVTLEQLMAESDVVSVHAPALPSTNHMINRTNLALLKDGALFINTSRGTLVDEKALTDELETGRIFACLDVTEPEPPDCSNRLLKMDNVIMTPHISGGHTKNGRYEQGDFILKQVVDCLTKGEMEYEITKDVFNMMA